MLTPKADPTAESLAGIYYFFLEISVLVTPSVTSGSLLNSNTSRELPDQSLAEQRFIGGVHLVLEMVPVSTNGTVLWSQLHVTPSQLKVNWKAGPKRPERQHESKRDKGDGRRRKKGRMSRNEVIGKTTHREQRKSEGRADVL